MKQEGEMPATSTVNNEPPYEQVHLAPKHRQQDDIVRHIGGRVLRDIEDMELLASIMRHPSATITARSASSIFRQLLGNSFHDKL